jgi:hypothetical protein
MSVMFFPLMLRSSKHSGPFFQQLPSGIPRRVDRTRLSLLDIGMVDEIALTAVAK